MSYGVSAALQAAIYQRLTSSSALTSLVGDAIYDNPPPGTLPGTYVSLGPEEVRDRSDVLGRGALHIFSVSVVTDAAGFQTAKSIAAVISDRLVDAKLQLSRGTLTYLNFERAVARRVGAGETRRIDLRFRARVEEK